MERLADLDIFGFLLHLGNGSVARRGRHRFIAGIHHEKCSGDRIFLICAVVAAGAVDVRASYLSPSAAVFLLLLPFFFETSFLMGFAVSDNSTSNRASKKAPPGSYYVLCTSPAPPKVSVFWWKRCSGGSGSHHPARHERTSR